MGDLGLGQHKTIKDFVRSKLRAFEEQGLSMETLFSLMFQEKENIMYERSAGYRVESFSYGEVEKRIKARALSLSKLLSDVAPGSVIGLSMDNSLSWIECFWAILLCGFRPLLINLRLSQEPVEGAIRDCDVQAVVSDGRTYSVRTILCDEIEPVEEPFTTREFGKEIIVMTSGTSRHIKLCAYSAEELFYQIKGSYSIIRECDTVKRHYQDRLKLLTFLPFYHVFGLVAVYIWFSFFSRTFVELKDMKPDTITGTVRRHHVTHLFAVPLFWETVYTQARKTIRLRGEETERKFEKAMALRDKLGDSSLGALFTRAAFKEVRENLFGDSIRFMITGGSSISKETMRFFNNIGYHLADGYGMSEIGITSLELSKKPSILNAGYIGKPMDGVEYRINDDGELEVKGKAIACYIIEDGEKKIINTDFFNTHDLAVCENGHYKILGRKDDLIVGISGENLNPNLIEPQLKLKDVNEVCLIGALDGVNTVPTLVVSVNRFISEEKLTALDHSLKKQLEEMRLNSEIKRILYVSDSLIVGDEFKLNRLRLKQQLEENGFHEVKPLGKDEGLQDALAKRLREFFAAALDRSAEDIADGADFFLDLGGTSLDYFGMIAAMETEFSVKISTEQNLSTVAAFHRYLSEIL
ncbi:AMP-binding protein [Ruminococcus sp.]|uniref:AMP-binding protein n=1 Tax=Ruminococcus sp. TaxID=41978 RepID=UPI002E813D85|nr:AMP-binding protein [Ruminococcus sp.]MEE3491528.1 AMP-binding protein [Ruminococcus sp.]